METVELELESVGSSGVPCQSFRLKLGEEKRLIGEEKRRRSTVMLRDSLSNVATVLEFCLVGGCWGAPENNKGNEYGLRVTKTKACLLRHL